MAYVVTGYWNAGYDDQQSSAELISELQAIAPSEVIELFQLELNTDQHGTSTTHYFSAAREGGAGGIVFGGQTYTAIPLEADGFAYNGQGSLPRPTFRISNLFSTITALIATLPNGLEGAKVTRLRTLAKYIDSENFIGSTYESYVVADYWEVGYSSNNTTADSTALFPKEVYYVDRKSAENRNLIEFELASAFDLAGVRAPKRQCISRCQWVYKSAECGYDPTDGPGKNVDGVQFTRFNASDEGVLTDAEDVCGKKQSSCECRFGDVNELPFGGYPGIGTFFA
jgi:lambda family phage minor tail protein L|tara:strand:- start:675 stop:1526 length:852 start_codon:yes stop_codon:yes gene_type:complete